MPLLGAFFFWIIIMKLLFKYFALQKEVFDYFGYVEDWKSIPLDDATDQFWQLNENSDGSGSVRFSEEVEKLQDKEAGDYYENEIYTQRFLPKWVYRGKDYTMISVDTHCDGNKFLQIFDNKKEIKE